jgi:ubiquinone/menaquinone biosynthesis C-methylase UbiE
MLDLPAWHQRFLQQAQWTKNLRAYLFSKIPWREAESVLEVGCGTGAVLNHLPPAHAQPRTGVDINLPRLRFAQKGHANTRVVCADGAHLPFPNGAFSHSFCHFLLLWVDSPSQIMAEMKRVTKAKGCVMALAEPDYGGRIDFPDSLEPLGRCQTSALADQGAEVRIGRRLRALFANAELEKIETGILGAQWAGPAIHEAADSEWQTLRSDLRGRLSADQLRHFENIDRKAKQEGQRVLYVPTFYAIGFVP